MQSQKPLPDIPKIPENLDALPQDVKDFIYGILQVVVDLKIRIAELEGKINKDSHNSSKPPSTDGFKKKTNSLRPESNKKSGGQEGHPGSHLKKSNRPDKIVVHPVSDCGNCGCSLKHIKARHRSAQTFDFPEIKITVTEHRVEIKDCRCGHTTSALFPPEVTGSVCYGQNIKALCVYLVEEHHIPLERCGQIIFELAGQRLSEGTLINWIYQSSDNLEKFDTDVVEHLKAEKVLHTDETGIFGKLRWLHVKTTENVTRYFAHKKRGREANIEEGILESFKGVLVHDFWACYYSFPACFHAVCNAHILRELAFFYEEEKRTWAGKMIRQLLKIKKAVDNAKAKGKNELSEYRLAKYRKHYLSILKSPRIKYKPHPKIKGKRGRNKQADYKNFLDRLWDNADDVLRFMDDFRIPFDNNISERALRMVKVKMKVSGCFRSEKGAKSFCKIKTYLATARKNGHNLLEVLKISFMEEVRLSQILGASG